MDPLVSVLIPAFNAEPWVAAAIGSVLEQTWERTEIVVVDDGSSDRTLHVARQFASPRVSVVGQSHQGAAAARNRALSLCQGDYIQWLDADDLLAPDKIARQLEARRAGAGGRTLLSCSWGRFFHRPHRAEFAPTALWCDLSPLDWLVRKLELDLFMPLSTWLVSRELTQAAGSWDTRLSVDDDGEYFCRVLLASDGTRFVPEARAYYRRAGGRSLSSSASLDRNLESQCLSLQLHVAHLRSLEDSERTRRACLRYLQRWLIYFHPERPDLVRSLEELAHTLGGRLEPTRLPRKYEWIRRGFGWRIGKQAWRRAPRWKLSLRRGWDLACLRVEERLNARGPASSPGPRRSGRGDRTP